MVLEFTWEFNDMVGTAEALEALDLHNPLYEEANNIRAVLSDERDQLIATHRRLLETPDPPVPLNSVAGTPLGTSLLDH